MTVSAYVALGSNLDDPPTQLANACNALQHIDQTRLEAVSSVFRSSAVGPGNQPDYLNAVAQLITELPALALLQALQQIERAQGRVRDEHWGPRTLDLDLLLYGDVSLETDTLTLPHPRMYQRDFVLLPLQELWNENGVLPNGSDLATLLRACADNRVVKTSCELPTGR
ncbi:MAG: 2-amino-4-hydroxy-6-hydroxymethyldihydropteridine diphosphokinase [Halioglobus sp.]